MLLAERRAAMGLSLSDVANRLKFAPRQIEALEAGEYDKLPGMTFVRGMTRGYARLLELDAEPLVRALERGHAPEPVPVEMHSESIPFPDGRKGSTRIYLSLSALILLAVGAVLYEGRFGMPQILVRGHPSAASSLPAVPAAASPEPPAAAAVPPVPEASVAVPAAAASEAPSGTAGEAPAARIQLQFQEQSWVEVRDGSGNVLTSQINPARSTRTVEGDPPFALVIGNASHVRMTYKNEPVDLKPYTKTNVARLTLK